MKCNKCNRNFDELYRKRVQPEWDESPDAFICSDCYTNLPEEDRWEWQRFGEEEWSNEMS